jgi:O-antigen/teichoic acid export membrane protein
MQTLAALLQLGTMALIASGYGPAGNGAYVIALLLPAMLTTFLNLGVNSANVYFLGSSRFTTAAVLAVNLRLLLALGVAGLVAGAVLIQFKSEQLFPGIAPIVLWIALLTFPLSLAQVYFASIFQGLQKFRHFNAVMLVHPTLVFVAAGALVSMRVPNVAWLVMANLCGVALALSLSWFLLVKHRRNVGVAGAQADAATVGYLKEALKYGNKVYLSNVLTLVQSRADVFLINLLISPIAAGIYAIAFQLGEKLWMLSHAISVVILPKLSELAGNEGRRIQITTIISRIVLAVSALGALVGAAIAYPLIAVVFGEQYNDSYLPFLLLLPGIVALASARVIANDIAARGKPELNLYRAMCAVVLSVGGNLLALPRFGIEGAAIVTSTAYVVDLCLKLLVYRSITSAPLSSLLLLRVSDLEEVKGAFGRGEPKMA